MSRLGLNCEPAQNAGTWPQPIRSSTTKKAMIRFESLGAPPAEAVRDEERVLRANVEEAERHVKQREHEAGRDQLEICRVRFLEVVNQTLIDYRRRIRQVSEIAGVDSEVDIPNLVNDDRLLDEAKIGVRFRFNNERAASPSPKAKIISQKRGIRLNEKRAFHALN